MNTRKPRKPVRLITAKQLRCQHGLSWHRVQRRVDRGQIIPFAFCVGPGGNEQSLWHPDQIEELKQACLNRIRKNPWVESSLNKNAKNEDMQNG